MSRARERPARNVSLEVPLADGAVLGPLMIGGIRNDMPTATAYWFDASIDEVLQLPTRVDLGASRGRLVPLQLAGPSSTRSPARPAARSCRCVSPRSTRRRDCRRRSPN